MTLMSRRSMLQGVGVATLATAMPSRPTLAQTALRGGCCLRCAMGLGATGPDATGLGAKISGMVSTAPGDLKIVRSTGDAETDHFLGLGLLRLATTFNVKPGFAFFDDGRSPNAFATDRTIFPDSSGTVLMGMRLFSQRMTQDGDSGLSLIAICAHEFGHIHQMQRGYDRLLKKLDTTVKPAELHADFLAGYFLADRKQEHPDFDVQNVGRVFYALGDSDFNAPQHHGTSEERIEAISAGYKFGKEKHTIDEASVAAFAQVSRMI